MRVKIGPQARISELENAVEMLVALSQDGALDAELLGNLGPDPARPTLTLAQRMDAYERGVLVEALRGANGNKSEAARALGVGRVTLYEKLKKHGIGDGG